MELTRLRFLRRKINENQSTTAAHLNISREAYSMYENGHRQPSAETLASMARYHHVSVDYLLGITDIPNSLDGLHAKEQYILSYLPYLDEYMKDFIISIIRFDPYIEKRRLDAIGREAGNENIPSEKSPEETANFSKHIENSK